MIWDVDGISKNKEDSIYSSNMKIGIFVVMTKNDGQAL